ncbi:MAG: OmpA family protein [Bacteroidia bacterium]|nr:OmpA family protein [Bacteroidia bacterium]
MIRLFLPILILSSVFCVGQSDSVEIKGRIFSADNQNVFVQSAEIVLKYNNGKAISCFSNQEGKYSIKIKKDSVYGELSVKVYPNTKSTIKDGKSYLAKKSKYTIYLSNKDTLVADFFLSPAIICRSLPSIEFKLNSTETVFTENFQQDSISADYVIEEIKQTMMENPSMIIEIEGYCDIRENNSLKLSEDRALFIKNELIKKNIAEKRIKIKGYGSLHLLVTNNIIAKAKTKKEKEALHQLNRRASFRILSWDYKE